jgi:hypothetical protein
VNATLLRENGRKTSVSFGRGAGNGRTADTTVALPTRAIQRNELDD